MALTEPYTLNAVTVTATELSIISGTTTLSSISTDGVVQVVVDASNMAKGDEFILRGYEAALSGGTKRLWFEQSLLGVQTELVFTPPTSLYHAWDFTLQKIAGTDRAFTASVRVAA